jgi:hypothetical protein
VEEQRQQSKQRLPVGIEIAGEVDLSRWAEYDEAFLPTRAMAWGRLFAQPDPEFARIVVSSKCQSFYSEAT